MSVGSNIKLLRDQHHETQRELGLAIGVSEMAVSQWENERSVPRMGSIERMALHWGVSKSRIVADEMDQPMLMTELTVKEQSLVIAYRDLNDSGREILIDLADALRSSGKYR